MNRAIRFQRLKQKIYIVMPLFFLILCLGLFNFAPRWIENAPVTPTTLPVASNGDRIIDTGTAVPPSPFPTPTLIPTPYPTLPPEAMITLLGPPQDGRFQSTDTITFYWAWPIPLLKDQQMSIYARLDGQDTLLGSLDEPNLGHTFRLHVDGQALADIAAESRSVQWFIQLQSTEQPHLQLAESEVRTLNIMP